MTEQWKKKSARFGWLAGAIAGAALTASLVSINHDSAAQPAAVRPASVRSASSPASFADVIESVSPAVVNIMVSKVDSWPPCKLLLPVNTPAGLPTRSCSCTAAA